MFIKWKKVELVLVLGELFHFQRKASLLFSHKTNCDADSRLKHIIGYLQAEVTNTARSQQWRWWDYTNHEKPSLCYVHILHNPPVPLSNQITGGCNAIIEHYVTMKSSSDIVSTAVRSSNLWCDDTLTYCLVRLSGPSPLRTCKSLWLRNAFPVTVPASWANTRMIILLQKFAHTDKVQQNCLMFRTLNMKGGSQATSQVLLFSHLSRISHPRILYLSGCSYLKRHLSLCRSHEGKLLKVLSQGKRAFGRTTKPLFITACFHLILRNFACYPRYSFPYYVETG